MDRAQLLVVVVLAFGLSVARAAAAKPGGDSFTFLVYGDHRDGAADHARVVRAMRDEAPDLVLDTGDLVAAGGRDDDWHAFNEASAPLRAVAPLYPAAGNHEYEGDPLLEHLRRAFVFPDSPPVIPETGGEPLRARASEPGAPIYYSFRFANALFVALDSNRARDREQAAWLGGTLAAVERDASVRHVFVFFHHPPFAVGDMCGQAPDEGPWLSELAHHHVRAVFSGHSHSYQRAERRGVRYFVTGGGGAPRDRDLSDCAEWDRDAVRAYRAELHYLRVRVRGSAVQLDALTPDGAELDSLELGVPLSADGAAVPIAFVDPLPHKSSVAPRRARARQSSLWPTIAIVLLCTAWYAERRRHAQARPGVVPR